MKATVVDLRYRMNEILKALDRNEDVSILYHGKLKGVITPVGKNRSMRVREHRFFGMRKEETTVEQEMDAMRGGRFRAL